MFSGAPNPIRIQFAPSDKGKPELPPLILIHDSSGTTFNYFALRDLERDVWAIHDPNHWEATAWEGGVDDMASHYVQLVEAAGILGPVVLGGWSFGGYVAIAMARTLAAGTASITTAALLLIDSPYTFSQSRRDSTLLNNIGHDLHPAPLNNMPDLVRKSIARCDTMLENWNLPTWEREGSENSRHLASQSIHERFEGGQVTCVERNSDIKNGDSAFKPTCPPPAILVRCKNFVANQENSSNICLVDLHRHEKLLGWENDHLGFIKAVVEVDANHYNIFDINDSLKMESLTRSLKEILAIFDITRVDQKNSAF